MKSGSKTVFSYDMSQILPIARQVSSIFTLPEILNIENDEYKHILSEGPTASLIRCILTFH